jgi:hypothetical protein
MPEKAYKEWVDFQEKIGIWKDKSGIGLDADTHFGIIHYGKEGAHIVPSNPHINGNFMDISYIRSSIQVALLGHITPNLRAVSIECKENEIKLLFYYDDLPSEDERELANLSDTEFISDFPVSVKTNFEIIHLPKPSHIPKLGMLVYLRHEI